MTHYLLQATLQTVLWAAQAFIPPGTTDARALQTVPTDATGAQTIPTVLPAVGIPAGVAPGQPGQPGQPAQPGQPGQAGAAAGALPAPGVPAPSVPRGRFQQMPPAAPNASGSKPQTPLPAIGIPDVDKTNKAETAPAAPDPPSCLVTLRTGRVELTAAGGEFLLPAVMKPAGCASSIAFSGQWLELTDDKQLRFVVQPNKTANVREVMILVGASSFLLRQMPLPQPGFAAVPSRLVFGVDKQGASRAKTLTAWSELPSANLTLRAADSWLVVTPKKSKEGRQVYEIAVRANSGLPPGRHDSHIEVLAGDTPQRSLTIPVVVEVEGVFY